MSRICLLTGSPPEEWKPLHPLTYLPRVLGSVTGIIGAVTLANASALAAWLSGETRRASRVDSFSLASPLSLW